MKRRYQQKREQPYDDDRADGESEDSPHHAQHVGRPHALRPPAGLSGSNAEEAIEEPAVPGQPDSDRLIERVAAAPAEVSRRVVAFAALPADEVARLAARGRFHGARARPGAGHDRSDGSRPARDGFVNRAHGDRRADPG